MDDNIGFRINKVRSQLNLSMEKFGSKITENKRAPGGGSRPALAGVRCAVGRAGGAWGLL